MKQWCALYVFLYSFELKNSTCDRFLNKAITQSGLKLSSRKFQMIKLLYLPDLCPGVELRKFTDRCFAVDWQVQYQCECSILWKKLSNMCTVGIFQFHRLFGFRRSQFTKKDEHANVNKYKYHNNQSFIQDSRAWKSRYSKVYIKKIHHHKISRLIDTIFINHTYNLSETEGQTNLCIEHSIMTEAVP